MDAVIGTLLFAVAVTLFAWSAVQYRLPVPANWTKNAFATMALALSCTSSLLFSIAFFSRAYLAAMAGEPVAATAIAAAMAILCITAFATRRQVMKSQSPHSDHLVFAAGFSGTMDTEDLTPANDSAVGRRMPVPTSPTRSNPRRRTAA